MSLLVMNQIAWLWYSKQLGLLSYIIIVCACNYILLLFLKERQQHKIAKNTETIIINKS